MFTKTQNSFAGGEMAPELFGRSDLEKHDTSVAVAQNFLIKEQGGAFSRPGMRLVCVRKYGDKRVALAKFVFSPTEKYCIEFGVGYIRFVTNAGYIQKNGQIYELPSSFTQEDLPFISYDQSGDVMFLAVQGKMPKTLTRYAEDDWRFESYQNEHGPFEIYDGDYAALSVEEDGRLLLTQLTGWQFSEKDEDGYFKLEKEFEAQSISFTQSGADTAEELKKRVFLCCGSWQLDTTGSWTGTIKLEQSEDGITWKSYRSYSSTMYEIGGSQTGQNFNSNGEISDNIRFLRINAENWSKGTAYIQFRINSFTYNLYGRIETVKSATQAYVRLDNLAEGGYEAVSGKVEYQNYTIPEMTSNTSPEGRAFYKEPGYTGSVLNEDGTQATTYDTAFKALDGTEETAAITPVYNFEHGPRIGYEFSSHKLISQINVKLNIPAEGRFIMTGWVYSKTAGWIEAGQVEFSAADPSEQFIAFNPVILDGFAVSFRAAELSGDVLPSTVAVEIKSLSANSQSVTVSSDEMKFFAPMWGKRQGWPNAVRFFQGRLGWFSGYHVELTKIDDYYSFETSLDIKDDDAVSANIKSSGMCTIRHAIGAGKLVVLTDGGEFVNSSEVVTPAASGFVQQSNFGSSFVRPILVGPRVLFVKLMGGRLYDFQYDYASDNFQAEDLCALAPHLFEGRQIVQIDYQSDPQGIVWVVLDNGALLSLSYARQHGLLAWTHHQTDGEVQGVCVLPGEKECEVFFAIKRGDIATIEVLGSQLPLEGRKNALCVDCAICREYGQEQNTVDGLEHLEGKAVNVLADGNAYENMLVQNGHITLPHPARTVTVGLPVSYKLTLLPLMATGNGGDYTGKLRPCKIHLYLKDSAGGKAGMEGLGSDCLIYGKDGELFTGEIEAPLASSHREHPQVVLEGKTPLPFNVTKITVEYN